MTIESNPTRGRAPLFLSVSVVCAGALLSGCMSSPTYGTDKTANEQLFEDVTGVLSFGKERGPEIAYNPRPELVKPATMEVLPEPQQELASADNPAWPESPEQRRARIRAEATENQGNAAYRSPIAGTIETARAPSRSTGNPEHAGATSLAMSQQDRAELQRRVRENNQGDATSRQYLSEPPLDYRRPSETAAVGDLGEDEWKKERRTKSATGKSSWRDWLPSL